MRFLHKTQSGLKMIVISFQVFHMHENINRPFPVFYLGRSSEFPPNKKTINQNFMSLCPQAKYKRAAAAVGEASAKFCSRRYRVVNATDSYGR
jgi:hypothetical protein